jgi:Protein phosphatase 2C
MAPMTPVVQTLYVPKAGNSEEEYEDAAGHSRDRPEHELDVIRLAVADGATEASFSRAWAGLLVKSFCAGELTPQSADDVLLRLEKDWKGLINARDLPWYAEEKLQSGAFAALIGVEVNGDGTWRAMAVGDCCVFLVRGLEIARAFPITTSDQFNNRPLLLSSLHQNNTGVITADCFTVGNWLPGDRFYLMSDAIAAWFLGGYEKDAGEHLGWLDEMASPQNFAAFVTRQRNDVFEGKPLMKNDDVTVTICKMP